MLKLTKTDISVWLVTFGLTVFADLTVAVEAGMILAALLFISRVASTTTVSQVTDDYIEDGRVHILQDKDIPYYATIFRIHGPFLFGATDKISVVTENLHKLPPVVILRLRNMNALDATGLFALEEVAKKLHETKRTLILCGAREQPAKLIRFFALAPRRRRAGAQGFSLFDDGLHPGEDARPTLRVVKRFLGSGGETLVTKFYHRARAHLLRSRML